MNLEDRVIKELLKRKFGGNARKTMSGVVKTI
mgnify:CR=1|jgi:hypothetical protein